MRPITLKREVIGYEYNGNSFQFALTLTTALLSVVRNILAEKIDDRQILVFINCSFCVNYRFFYSISFCLICLDILSE